MTRRIVLSLLLAVTVSVSLSSQTIDSNRTRNFSVRWSRHSEGWVRQGVIYEINPRSFSPEGNFAGIEKRLPELNKLGVTILWLMPIHPVGVLHRKGTLGSPYSVQYYYAIDPAFGTLADFKNLLNRAHQLGFHLIIDLVANHTSWDSRFLLERPEWFTKDSAGNIISPNPGWTDVADLDYSKPALRRAMIEMMKYWIRDVGIDGFRCDAAELVPTDFWEDARASVDSIKPVLMLSEGSWPEHHLKAFDLTYSWNIYHSLGPILRGERTARALDTELSREEVTFPRGSLRMRFSSNHDENAWDAPDVEKYGGDGAKLAAVVVNTLPGVPLLYNGQEVGNGTKLALFEKISIDWKGGGGFRELYTKLFDLRKNNPAFTDGGMVRLPTTNDRRVYAFARVSGENKFLVAFNFAAAVFSGSVNILSPELVSGNQITLTDVFNGDTSAITIPSSRLIPLSIPPMGYRILRIAQSSH